MLCHCDHNTISHSRVVCRMHTTFCWWYVHPMNRPCQCVPWSYAKEDNLLTCDRLDACCSKNVSMLSKALTLIELLVWSDNCCDLHITICVVQVDSRFAMFPVSLFGRSKVHVQRLIHALSVPQENWCVWKLLEFGENNPPYICDPWFADGEGPPCKSECKCTENSSVQVQGMCELLPAPFPLKQQEQWKPLKCGENSSSYFWKCCLVKREGWPQCWFFAYFFNVSGFPYKCVASDQGRACAALFTFYLW